VRGIFSQTVCLLADDRCQLEDLAAALTAARYEVRSPRATPDPDSWAFGGLSVLVPYRPEVNGYIAIDLVERPWPDAMGNPAEQSQVFGAWAMGNFGPFAYPGGLQRAVQQAWGWAEAGDVVAAHTRFARVRLSYVFGAGRDAKILPPDWSPLPELAFVNDLVRTLLSAHGVLCYFNPNGEVLATAETFGRTLEDCRRGHHLPLDLWSNVRFVRLSEELGLMDTVGNGQLEIPDLEAAFPIAEYDPNDVAYYLRNLSLYVLESGATVADGDRIDGPNEGDLGWIARGPLDQGTLDPPRALLRVYPARHAEWVAEVLGLEAEKGATN
jgi:hypothetical protein